jgi:CspA family cold shock protein
MKSGVIKFFNEEKGFGFIVPSDGKADIFFHISGLADDQVRENDAVEYEEEMGKKGLMAVKVTVVE